MADENAVGELQADIRAAPPLSNFEEKRGELADATRQKDLDDLRQVRLHWSRC